MADIACRTADVDGLTVFYREAGAPDAPTLVLLHGFPSAGHVFRELTPLPAGRFHLVAPDLPGSGKSDMPGRGDFGYTFEQLTDDPPRVLVAGSCKIGEVWPGGLDGRGTRTPCCGSRAWTILARVAVISRRGR